MKHEIAIVRLADVPRLVRADEVDSITEIRRAETAEIGFIFAALFHCTLEIFRLYLETPVEPEEGFAWSFYVGHSEIDHSYAATEHGGYFCIPIPNDALRKAGNYRLVAEGWKDADEVPDNERTWTEDRDARFAVI